MSCDFYVMGYNLQLITHNFLYMLSKNQIKLIRSLQQKKYREEHGLFIAEGEKVVAELINSDFKIHSIYIVETLHAPSLRTIPHEIISEKELSQISALTTPQGIIAVAPLPPKGGFKIPPSGGWGAL